MAKLNWGTARRPDWTENVNAPPDDLLGTTILAFCRDGTCVDGRYLVPIDRVTGILVAGGVLARKRHRGHRGEEWNEATEEALQKNKVRSALIDYCPFNVTYNLVVGCLVKPNVWLRGGGIGDPNALRRILVRVVNDDLELVPVSVPVT